MRRILLVVATLSSIATSRSIPGDDREIDPGGLARAVVENHGDGTIDLELAFAADPDCALLEEQPWLAAGMGFEESVVVQLPPGRKIPILAEEDDGMQQDCYVARLGLGAEQAIVYVGADQPVMQPYAELGAPAALPRVVVHPEGPTVFVDGGVGLLQDPEALGTCTWVEGPSWTPVDVEGTVEEASMAEDCLFLRVDETPFELCGAGELEVQVGASVRIAASEELVDLDVFAGPRVIAGAGLGRLFIEPEVELGDGLCAETLACGGVTEGLLAIGDELLAPGDRTELEDGVLTVLSVDHPLQGACAPSADILYVRR